MTTRTQHEGISERIAELALALLDGVVELKKSNLPSGEKSRKCEQELAYPIGAVLSLVSEEHRRTVVRRALELARRVTARRICTNSTRGSNTTSITPRSGDKL